MTWVSAYLRAGHGTEARARRHYRDGEKPCPACYEGQRQARTRLRAVKREKEAGKS